MDQDEDDFDRALKFERQGAIDKLNPMFGEWSQRFDIVPVPYGDGGAKRAALREAMQACLDNRFHFSAEVALEIVLHLDVETVLETSETADLDNYAKAILDGLKGPDGVLLDDTQVQALTISWLDSYGRDKARFEVAIKGSPDDFLLKPVEFYEMPDKLWYPHPRNMWTDGTVDPQSDVQHYAGLRITEIMSGVKKAARHRFRTSGMTQLRAYQHSKYISSTERGFHKSRVDTGFPMHSLREWKASAEEWRKSHPQEMDEIDQILTGMREAFDPVVDLLSGRRPDGG
jgi:Holliday junction resolvase RusA-like endonuclease